MSNAPTPSPKRASPVRPTTGSIRADEVLLKEELCRRLGWQRFAWRKARRDGLKAVRFGSRWYVRGEWVHEFLERLADIATTVTPSIEAVGPIGPIPASERAVPVGNNCTQAPKRQVRDQGDGGGEVRR